MKILQRIQPSVVNVACLLILLQTLSLDAQNMEKSTFDWQGHRGARGLLPENTIPSFLKALEYPVTTLELDVAVSKDNVVIVSHEPWMSEKICSKPDGSPVGESEAMKLKIRDLTYDEIKSYDCGSRGNSRFPEQQSMPVYKPSLLDVIGEVQKFCFIRALPLPQFNIEIKSAPELDGAFTPAPGEFARLLLEVIEQKKIASKVCIQSFDVRSLQAVKKQAPAMVTALLVENEDGFKKNLKRLGYVPEIYSPDYKLLRKRYVRKLHKRGIKVIPWTVNAAEDMRKLIRKGVDGIITDYPNLIPEIQAWMNQL
jgi:glycerophosphoryl diester phosphodiesterase